MHSISAGIRLIHWAVRRLVRDESGQDMIEYSLLAAAVVVVVAGFLPPQLMPAVTAIFSKIALTLASV